MVSGDLADCLLAENHCRVVNSDEGEKRIKRVDYFTRLLIVTWIIFLLTDSDIALNYNHGTAAMALLSVTPETEFVIVNPGNGIRNSASYNRIRNSDYCYRISNSESR